MEAQAKAGKGSGQLPTSSAPPAGQAKARLRPTPGWFVIGGAVLVSVLLSPPADSIADTDLTIHMFQHIGLFAFSIVIGYGLERYIMSKLASLRRLTYVGWKVFTSVMVSNNKTKGLAFVVVIPASVFVYWHFPQNFDLAVKNETVHVFEHLTYIVSGSLVGLSFRAIKPKWQVTLLYVAFMHAGMMGSIWSVWSPPFFPIYSSSANIEMDTALLVFGAIGVVVTSSWMLKVLDII